MTKSELIERLIAASPHLHENDVQRLVTIIFDDITAALVCGDRVEIRGFGAFGVKQRGGRVGRNPRSGEAVNVPPKNIPYFRTGKRLRNTVNGA